MTEWIVEKAELTDVGRRRSHNEDAAGHFEPAHAEELARSGRLYIVADGVGGAAAGEIASEYAVRRVLFEYYQLDEADLEARLQAAIAAAHHDLYNHNEQSSTGGRMGTTIVAAAIRGNVLAVGSVGDSRAYLIRDGQIHQLTRDHSLVAELLEEGAITPEEAEHHPRRNVLLRSLGTDRTVHPDTVHGSLRAGDRLLLCTDGLTHHVRDNEILGLVLRHPPRRAVRELVSLANVRGGKDNITVQLLHIVEEAPLEAVAATLDARSDLTKPEIDDLHETATAPRGPRPNRTGRPRWPWLAAGGAAALVVFLGVVYAWQGWTVAVPVKWIATGVGAALLTAVGVVLAILSARSR